MQTLGAKNFEGVDAMKAGLKKMESKIPCKTP